MARSTAQPLVALARTHASDTGLPLLLDIERGGAQVSLAVGNYRLPPSDALLAELARMAKDGRAVVAY